MAKKKICVEDALQPAMPYHIFVFHCLSQCVSFSKEGTTPVSQEKNSTFDLILSYVYSRALTFVHPTLPRPYECTCFKRVLQGAFV